VILDRDGTLVDVVRDGETGIITVAFHPDHLRLLPGVVAGLRALGDAGYALAIATNQPGAAKGQLTRAPIERTNAALVELLRAEGVRIEALEACLHHPDGGPGGDASLVGPCACRKPAPGMPRKLVADLGLDPARSWMVGDTVSDLDAAHAAGLRGGLVFDDRRCELCPLRAGPRGLAPGDVWGRTFDALAAAILAAG
jgi:D-glycero-D-manno-heptose 1,7-bisphosphate phosphatase